MVIMALQGCILDFSRSVDETEGIVDKLLSWLRSRGFSDVYGFSVSALQLRRHAVLTCECSTKTFPTEVDVAGFELKANRVDKVICEDGDE